MFRKIYGKLLAKLYQGHMKKVNKKKMTEQQKKQQEFYKELKALYNFVNWLMTKGFKNRQQKRTFCNAVLHNKPVMQEVLTDLISQYAPKKKEPKPVVLKEGKVNKGGVGTVPTTPKPNIAPPAQGKRN